MLARHATEAGQIKKAALLWGVAGQRSLERSALVEAAEQLTRALGQIAMLSATPALRREQIKLQVALANALMHTKGFSAHETRAALDVAQSLIERAEVLGEPAEDPQLLFSVLYGFWVANQVAFNGDVMRDLAAQFLTLAQKQETAIPLMSGHRLMGTSLLLTGDIVTSREHFDCAIALYDPLEHRHLATRFGVDLGVSAFTYRSWALWLRGYPQAALVDADYALKEARDIGQAATLMIRTLRHRTNPCLLWELHVSNGAIRRTCGTGGQKSALFRKAQGMAHRGCVLALSGKASDAVYVIGSGITALRATGATIFVPLYLSHLTRAYAELGQVDDARRCIAEAMTVVDTTKERWFEAEVNRIAGRKSR